MSISRGNLWKILAGSAILAGAGAYFYATRIESRSYRLEVEKLVIAGGGNGKGTHPPLRILHLSDLHLCYPESHKIEFLRRITAEPYDLIFLTGDIFENYSGLAYATSMLSCRPRLGAYAVLGNHDYYNYSLMNKIWGRIVRRFRHPKQMRNVQPMIEALEKGGFQVLRHEAVKLPEHGLHIVGIDYPSIDAQELQALVSEAQADNIKLVLFHVPMNLQDISESGAHMAFGGHTHGGQIRIPGYGAIITDSELPRRQAAGIFWKGDTAFHVSRGLGADPRTNMRLFCPPAATVIEITRA